MDALFFLSSILIMYLLIKIAKKKKETSDLEEKYKRIESEKSLLEAKNTTLIFQVKELEKYQSCVDAEAESKRIITDSLVKSEEIEAKSRAILDDADKQSKAIIDEAKSYRRGINIQLDAKKAEIESILSAATKQQEMIISSAKVKAEEIAGDAYRALNDVENLKKTAQAMENVIDGYGLKYLKPTYSILDEIAEIYSFDEAGKQLKIARERTKFLVENNLAGECDYVKDGRKNLAIMFVVDAFNGKVDSILTRVKVDNFGILEQQIRDAFQIVNRNGQAFREARITDKYLDARLEELRWAVAITALKEKEKAEQRAIREQIREEERARKEIEKALKEAAKEEEIIQKAMAKMEQQLLKASDEQKSKYESQLADLQQKLKDAESRSIRAQSMAQQTRSGHVYVISNIGSFGENVYKIGMTRRLEPLDRVKELGDASVPFSFDVHAMIWSEDAPKLEKDLHREFIRQQINKVNPRKEFFKVGIQELKQAIQSKGIEAAWTMAAEAAEYRESQAIEAQLIENPSIEQSWLKSQFEVDWNPQQAVEQEEAEELA